MGPQRPSAPQGGSRPARLRAADTAALGPACRWARRLAETERSDRALLSSRGGPGGAAPSSQREKVPTEHAGAGASAQRRGSSGTVTWHAPRGGLRVPVRARLRVCARVWGGGAKRRRSAPRSLSQSSGGWRPARTVALRLQCGRRQRGPNFQWRFLQEEGEDSGWTAPLCP